MKADNEFSATHNTSKVSAGSFFGHLRASIAATVILSVICCGLYPLVIWGISQFLFPAKANGSLVKKDGTPTTKVVEAVGSSLIGQNFTMPAYFHPRPSASGANGYDPTASGGSNFGPISDKLINGATQTDDKGRESVSFNGARLNTLHYAMENGITFDSSIPLDKFNTDGSPDDLKLYHGFHADPPLVFSNFKLDGKPVPIPGDAVTASASGLDPHISPRNAELQTARVATARGITPDQVKKLIEANTDQPSFGILGDPGVNVLMLNLALDAKYGAPAAPNTAPAAVPTTGPTTATTVPAASPAP